MKLHNLLLRQLSQLKLDDNSLPTSKKQWRKFLNHINQTYLENDQERYLIERSMDISSRELIEINAALNENQRLARLGTWIYDSIHDRASWSDELYRLLGVNMHESAPGYQEFIKRFVRPEDRKRVNLLTKDVIHKGKSFKLEMELKDASGRYRWYKVVVSPKKNTKISPQGNYPYLSGFILDIHEQKEYEESLIRLNKQMVDNARLVGMAEVASSVLHNIGNVLNSSNISLALIQEKLNQDEFKKLDLIAKMLIQHKADLAEFFLTDPKGVVLPKYLPSLSAVILKDLGIIKNETNNLVDYLTHIRDIIIVHQGAGRIAGFNETIDIHELIKNAILLSGGSSFKILGIQLKTKLSEIPPMLVDKTKVMQILVNLLLNAKSAVLASKKKDKKIIIIANLEKNDQVKVMIRDNGIGIKAKNLSRLFTFGFTTKKAGHGFGLHGCALSAKELNGKIMAESEGYEKGTRFIFQFPAKFFNKV